MNPNPLTDAELDRLEQLLDDAIFDGDSMRLDEIQAMLCAVISGPVRRGRGVGSVMPAQSPPARRRAQAPAGVRFGLWAPDFSTKPSQIRQD